MVRLFGKSLDFRSREERALAEDIKRIWASSCFDLDYYQAQSGYYFKSVPDGIKHYMLNGAYQGLNPNRFFDARWYSQKYAKFLADNKNPLLDYLTQGPEYERDPSGDFSNAWYAANYFDRRPRLKSPLQDYIEDGQYKGRITSPFTAGAAFAPAQPARFANLLRELVPQDGVLTFAAEFQVKPVPRDRRTPGPDEIAGKGPSTLESIRHPPAPYVATFDEIGVIGGTRLIVADNTTVLSDEIDAFRADKNWTPRPRDFYFADQSTLALLLHRRYPSKFPGGLHLMHEYGANYFHFIVEALPRLLLADEMGVSPDMPLILQKGLHPNLHHLLKLIDRDERPIIELENRHIYIADSLTVVSDLSSIQDVYERPRRPSDTVLPARRIRTLIDRVLQRMNAERCGAPGRRLYLRRGGKYRSIVNEHAIEALLVKRGFEFVSTEALSFETQFWLMRQAAVVIAPTGAALANILWCQEGTSICILAAAHEAMPMEIWTQLGAIAKCEVTILYGERLRERDDVFSMHENYSIDLEALRHKVEPLL